MYLGVVVMQFMMLGGYEAIAIPYLSVCMVRVLFVSSGHYVRERRNYFYPFSKKPPGADDRGRHKPKLHKMKMEHCGTQ